ncbi:MAG TPA: hypothetical protein ENO12_00840 [Thermoplasmatales archaeon]|nr:hypothetical protein [Thermoplasmatales archaeon]
MNMKFKYLVIFVTGISLVVLYGASLISQPTKVSLSSLSNNNGQQVMVQGRVTDYRTTNFGSQLITLREYMNSNVSVVLYLEGVVSVEFGDRIQAIGKVQRYKNQWEITVSNPQFVTILEKWDNQSFPLWQLAENPERYANGNVNVTGVVSQKHSSKFVLSDATKTHLLEVSCDSSSLSWLSIGDAVAVAGRFFYDPCFLRYLLKVSDDTHRITKLKGETYA